MTQVRHLCRMDLQRCRSQKITDHYNQRQAHTPEQLHLKIGSSMSRLKNLENAYRKHSDSKTIKHSRKIVSLGKYTSHQQMKLQRPGRNHDKQPRDPISHNPSIFQTNKMSHSKGRNLSLNTQTKQFQKYYH